MIFNETPLKGSFVIDLSPVGDERGWFTRVFCKNEFKKIGHTAEWVQINHSYSQQKGTVRGMHFQKPPFSEIKLVRCIAGAVWDVIVDIRQGSPTFLQYFAQELSAGNKKMMYIPEGFAHGFQCLADDCELIYHHTSFYAPGSEGGIRFDDKRINIEWPIPVTVISERDQKHPLLETSYTGIKL